MKKGWILLAVIFFVPFLLAASIDIKEEYMQGETIIAKISAYFASPIDETNIVFYRDGHVKIPMDYEVQKLGDYYFLKVSLASKSEGNYSIAIENTQYYSGGKIVEGDIRADFLINSEMASFEVDPGYVLTSGAFDISMTSFSDDEITISIDNPSEISSADELVIGPAQTETVSFASEAVSEDTLVYVSVSEGSTDYEIPVYIFGTSTTEMCGDGKIDSGELCDGDNFGDISSCEDFGFEAGTLYCYAPGTYGECTFNTSGCFNYSGGEPECGNGIIEAGEQCDGNTWGTVRSCSYFDFDAGELDCVDCAFDTSDCYDYDECERDRDCKDGYECDSGECVKKENYCKDIDDCDDNQYCEDHECFDKECDSKGDCDDDEECKGYICVPLDRECTPDTGCVGGKVCINYECVLPDEKECTPESGCDEGEVCKNNQCVPSEITEKTCSDIGGEEICADDEKCPGDFNMVNNRKCCFEKCIKESTTDNNPTNKIIGYVLLGVLLVGLIFFYFKFKKTKKKSPDLAKIGNAPRVKGNLLR